MCFHCTCPQAHRCTTHAPFVHALPSLEETTSKHQTTHITCLRIIYDSSFNMSTTYRITDPSAFAQSPSPSMRKLYRQYTRPLRLSSPSMPRQLLSLARRGIALQRSANTMVSAYSRARSASLMTARTPILANTHPRPLPQWTMRWSMSWAPQSHISLPRRQARLLISRTLYSGRDRKLQANHPQRRVRMYHVPRRLQRGRRPHHRRLKTSHKNPRHPRRLREVGQGRRRRSQRLSLLILCSSLCRVLVVIHAILPMPAHT
jgi:hypothetical protein